MPTYTVYCTVERATEYLNASLTGYAVWAAAGEIADQQDRAMVEASRIFDRQRWKGAKTSTTQDLAWPRTGITDPDGVALSSAVIPEDILDGFCELLVLLLQGKSMGATNAQAGRVKKLSIQGEVDVEFNGAPGGAAAKNFPPQIQDLIGWYLLSGASMAAETVSGGAYYPEDAEAVESVFEDADNGRLKHGL